MGNLFACMRPPTTDGSTPAVEITIKANCCNSKKIKVSLDNEEHVEQILSLARSLSKSKRSLSSTESSSPDASLKEEHRAGPTAV